MSVLKGVIHPNRAFTISTNVTFKVKGENFEENQSSRCSNNHCFSISRYCSYGVSWYISEFELVHISAE